jgi:hypothetical protein
MAIYLNPYQLFDLAIDSSETAIQANREYTTARIKHTSDSETVHIGSSTLLKKEVVRLLNELDNATIRAYHIAIFENKKLLKFLEYGHLNFFKSDARSLLPQDSDFLTFIAPYFGYQYGETLLQAIKTQDKDTLTLLASTPLPMTGDFEEQCYKHANLYVESTINELKDLQAKEELSHLSERELLSYLPNRTIELYNMLPDYFYAARNLIGNEVYQLSVVLNQNFGRSDGANAMLKQGLKLKLDDTVRQNLESMLQKFNVRATAPSFIWIGILAILLLFLIKYIEINFIN